jgi:hypothetical protein
MGRRFRMAVVAALAVCAGCGTVRRVDHSVEKLAATLKDSDPNMRYWAAESLGHFGPEAKSAVPDLAATLNDDSKMVRMGAAYALAEIGPAAEPARGALIAASKDPEKEVRDAASYALRRISAKVPAKTPSR